MASVRRSTVGAEFGGRVPGRFPGVRLPGAPTVTDSAVRGWRFPFADRAAYAVRSGKIFWD